MTDVDLILEWVEKYFEMASLVRKVLSIDDSENPPVVPSLENEIEYQHLRYWFRKNNDRFVPIWINFRESIGESLETTGSFVEDEFKKNPFQYFYHPDNLIDMVYRMGGTTSADIWDPENKEVEAILNAINMFYYTAMHLRYWIGEFANETSETDHLIP
jgi:hypothetical protein